MRKTKNNSLRSERNRNFILLGDPMLKPAYPTNQIIFTEINQKPFNQIDTLSALEKVMIKGEIQSLSGQLIEDFNGTATINIFDRQTEKKTRGKQNPEFVYTVQENRIFKGQATVSEGMFEIEFIVPKNISYVFENGKIEAYAVNDEETEDASGASRELLIGGTSKNAEDDRTPPIVQLFVNDSTRTTSTVGRNALLFANVFDESGINMTGLGLGQNIELTLSDGRSFILNDYYTANADTYQRGTIVFPIRDLTPGNYTAELKIFDTYNNSTVESVNFIVSEKANVDLYSVINYPNPVQSGSTTFSFEHNRPGESLNLKIHIYDMNGKMIQIFETEATSNLNKVDGVEIDLAPFSIDPGIYFYRLSVESDLDNATGEYVGRLIYMN
jgi:hypothetical protein